MPKATSARQGDADGLCGLYSLLNFLQTTDLWKDETRNDILWYLLETCQQLGWLSPLSLTWGFEEHQLKAIIQAQFDNFRMPYVAYSIGDIEALAGEADFRVIAEKVCHTSDHYIVANIDNNSDGHWVLVSRVDGQLKVFDSAARRSTVPIAKYEGTFYSEWGVVIIPYERPKLSVAL